MVAFKELVAIVKSAIATKTLFAARMGEKLALIVHKQNQQEVSITTLFEGLKYAKLTYTELYGFNGAIDPNVKPNCEYRPPIFFPSTAFFTGSSLGVPHHFWRDGDLIRFDNRDCPHEHFFGADFQTIPANVLVTFKVVGNGLTAQFVKI
jgi:hypothetical protein